MTILFLILTTKANANTRQKWQRETWLRGVDYVYLDEPYNGEESYLKVAWKYVAWLRANELKHDWYFFCDDDTWVYVDRLKAFLQLTKLPIMAGFKGGKFVIEGTSLITEWCSGGAGICISKVLLEDIQRYVKGNPIVSTESDTSLAIWAKMSRDWHLTTHVDKFRPSHPGHYGDKDCITFHYCTEKDFYELNKGK